MDIHASLMSPPEAIPLDSFAQHQQPHLKYIMGRTKRAPVQAAGFLSPPVSPESKPSTPDDTTATATPIRDPILFPNSDSQNTSSSPPLFANDEAAQARRVVKEHVKKRRDVMFREVSPPREQDYHAALEFKSQVFKLASADPQRWLAREKEFLKEDQAIRAAKNARKYATIAPASGIKVNRQPKPAGNRSTNGITKPARQHKPARDRGVTPEGGKRPAREDKDFAALTDYSPPLSSLLEYKPHALKVDWKGSSIDLDTDPYAHLLHPDERHVASQLRLDCATYLTSKRRIFIRRIEALRIHKEFRKTDAQQACKIDVNKASKLWTAFEKVGWFDPKWVERYL